MGIFAEKRYEIYFFDRLVVRRRRGEGEREK